MQREFNKFSVNLPAGGDLNTWSKELVKTRLTDSIFTSDFRPFVQENNLYQLNENMIVLYDFHKNPLKGKYQSVILDKKDGIILCQKNSRQFVVTPEIRTRISGVLLCLN